MVLVEDARDVAEANVRVAVIEPRQSEHRFEIVGDAVLVDRRRRQRHIFAQLFAQFLFDFVGCVECVDLFVEFLFFVILVAGRDSLFPVADARGTTLLLRLIDKSLEDAAHHQIPFGGLIRCEHGRQSHRVSVCYVCDQAVNVALSDKPVEQNIVVRLERRLQLCERTILALERVDHFGYQSAPSFTRRVILPGIVIRSLFDLAVDEPVRSICDDFGYDPSHLDVYDETLVVALGRNLAYRTISLARLAYLRDPLALPLCHGDESDGEPRREQKIAHLGIFCISRRRYVRMLPRQKGAVLHEQNGYLHIFIL